MVSRPRKPFKKKHSTPLENEHAAATSKLTPLEKEQKLPSGRSIIIITKHIHHQRKKSLIILQPHLPDFGFKNMLIFFQAGIPSLKLTLLLRIPEKKMAWFLEEDPASFRVVSAYFLGASWMFSFRESKPDGFSNESMPTTKLQPPLVRQGRKMPRQQMELLRLGHPEPSESSCRKKWVQQKKMGFRLRWRNTPVRSGVTVH